MIKITVQEVDIKSVIKIAKNMQYFWYFNFNLILELVSGFERSI